MPSADIAKAIRALCAEKNAIILAHFYQEPAIQDVADFVGDSLDLARKAAATDADIIVFCGVRFMAEVAKILNPGKKVLIPDPATFCSLEDACPPDRFAAFRSMYPDHLTITYINCSAAVKAQSDVIVTSSNAEHIINQIPMDQPILMAPDRHLGAFLSKRTGREMKLWPGVCIVHENFSEHELLKLKAAHPDAPVVAHPECPSHILDHADFIGSTSAILNHVLGEDAETFIIATEPGILHQMRKAAPGRTFIGAPGMDGKCNCNTCPYMALNTMEKLYAVLCDETHEITVAEDMRVKALAPLERMLSMSMTLPGLTLK